MYEFQLGDAGDVPPGVPVTSCLLLVILIQYLGICGGNEAFNEKRSHDHRALMPAEEADL